ncbi:MAG: hypothetical protein AAGF78_10565 [Pseudomonadota bacterium]
MTPDFALHFTADDISLDQRHGTGWLTLGSASFRSGQFAGEITALRAKGEAAARAAGIRFATKLVLPNDQIKFLKLREGDATEASVAMALEGATPYAIAELLFDWRSETGLTRIAAVARETLDEAASFATENGLAPAAFVALPEDGWGDTEAFFGPFEGSDAARDPAPYRRWQEGEDIPPLVPDEADEQEEPQEEVAEETAEDAVGDLPKDVLPADPGDALSPEEEPTEDAAAQPAPTPAPEPPAPRPAPAAGKDAPPEPKAKAPPVRLAAPIVPPTERTAPPVPSPITSAPAPLPEAAALAATLKPVEPAQGFAFQSQRSRTAQVAPPPPPRAPIQHSPAAEAATLDGAAVKSGGAKPRFLGLILTAVLIVALLAVAAFASIREDGLAGVWQRLVPAGPDAPMTALAVPDADQAPPETVNIAPTPLSVVDPPREVLPDTEALEAAEAEVPLGASSDTELQRVYAASGIWPRAPAEPRAPLPSELSSFYVTSIDTALAIGDAVALSPIAHDTDRRPATQALPPTAGATFRFNGDGLLIATPDGAVSPLGYTVIAGRPPLEPPLRTPSATDLTEESARLAAFRPALRPDNLSEAAEREALGGLTRLELAGFRPQARPETTKAAEEVEVPDAPPSDYAVAASLRPENRPRNFDRIVARTRASQPSTVEVAAAVAPRTTSPSGPTRATVARAATTENAINLRRVNLIGVYGTPSNRSALVRLANGRFVKVQVGARLDGGRVAAISESALRYTKGGRNITLEMPS